MFTAMLLFKRLPIKYFDAFNLALVFLNHILRSWLEPVALLVFILVKTDCHTILPMLISREELTLRFSRTCRSGPIENSIVGLQGRLEKTEILDQNLLSEALNLILENSFNERGVLIAHIHIITTQLTLINSSWAQPIKQNYIAAY